MGLSLESIKLQFIHTVKFLISSSLVETFNQRLGFPPAGVFLSFFYGVCVC